jgi:hypothetical protein
MEKRNNADGVVGLPDRNTGARHHRHAGLHLFSFDVMCVQRSKGFPCRLPNTSGRRHEQSNERSLACSRTTQPRSLNQTRHRPSQYWMRNHPMDPTSLGREPWLGAERCFWEVQRYEFGNRVSEGAARARLAPLGRSRRLCWSHYNRPIWPRLRTQP